MIVDSNEPFPVRFAVVANRSLFFDDSKSIRFQQADELIEFHFQDPGNHTIKSFASFGKPLLPPPNLLLHRSLAAGAMTHKSGDRVVRAEDAKHVFADRGIGLLEFGE